MNPSNFESYLDPNGGEWIRMTIEAWKDVVWRPANLGIGDDGNLSFQIELFTGPGIKTLTDEDFQLFGKVAANILTDMIAAEKSELDQLVDENTPAEEPVAEETQQPVKPELSDHISSIGMLQGGMQVAPEMMPQDLSMDLAQIEGIIGGVAPQNRD